jgi:hypothetical protein
MPKPKILEKFFPSSSGSASSLRPENDEIRLISLLPGTWHEPIACKLTTVSLKDTTLLYEALSYVWAAEPGRKSIQLDGKPHWVSTNLFFALQRLRKAKDTRTIWIDVLCINQANLREKTHQVSMMGEIYTRTSKVFLWLGEYNSVPSTQRDNWTLEQSQNLSELLASGETDEGLAAFNLIRELASNKHLYELSCYSGDSTSLKVADRASLDALRAFWSLMDRPWWNRIWTVQETILPPKVSLIFGSVSASWQEFSDASICCRNHYQSCCALALQSMQFEHVNGMEKFAVAVAELDMIRKRFFESKYMLPFHELLWWLRCRDATDHRDMIYALLGFASDINPQLGFVPDYKASKKEVYKRIAVASMKAEGSLSILYGRRSRDSGMPTWVTNWAAPIGHRTFRIERERLRQMVDYRASRDMELRMQPKGDFLRLYGVFVDRVSAIGQLSENNANYVAIGRVILNWYRLAGFPKDYSQPYIGGKDWRNAFWRTLARDKCSNERHKVVRLNPDDDSVFVAWWTNTSHGEFAKNTKEISAWRYQRQLTFSTEGQRFFLTQAGYMGLGKPKVGDEIYVLFGGNVPFVLRPVANTTYFSLIGDCYLHGIMDGEAMTDLKRRTRRIVLR